VTERSIRFVKQHGHFKSDSDALYFNSTRYPVEGHSALLLPKYQSVRKAVHDYNDAVFDEQLMYTIRSSVSEDDRRHVQRMLAIKHTLSDVEFHLCTNAPLRYCEQVMNSLALPMDLLFDTKCAFTSDNDLVKPQPEFWDSVEQHPYFSDHTSTIELVDDSLVHVLSVKDRSRWMPHFINTDKNLYTFMKSLYSPSMGVAV
jgi:hypothetical protein